MDWLHHATGGELDCEMLVNNNVIERYRLPDLRRAHKRIYSHKAFQIINEIRNRMKRKPIEFRGEYVMYSSMYKHMLMESIKIKKMEEYLDARRDILSDDTVIWPYLTTTPYSEWRDACVDLWSEIGDDASTSREHMRMLGNG